MEDILNPVPDLIKRGKKEKRKNTKTNKGKVGMF